MRPLHVCLISQEYPPETGWGGVGAYTYELAAHGLARAGQRVTVLALATGEESVRVDGDVEVHRVRPVLDWGRVRLLWRLHLNQAWPGFAWAAARRLRQIHAQTPVDLVEASENASSLFVPLLRRRPRLVVRFHTASVFMDRLNGVRPGWKQRVIYWQQARAIRGADAWTAPSRAVASLTAGWLGLDASKVHVVPNPVNAASYSPGAGPRKKEVMVVGRLERLKGMPLLVEAVPLVLRRCPDASFRFVGRDMGDQAGTSWREHFLRSLPAPDHARVTFEQLPRHEVIDRYKQAWISVNASAWENGPYALMEAMASGLPPVALHVGGIPELVEEGRSGLLVREPCAAALADAASKILESAPLRDELGAAARQRILDFASTEQVVPRMIETYRQVVGR